MKKLIITLLCFAFLLTAYSQRRDNRPANEWWIYFLDEDGNKRSMLIETTYPDRALEMFRKKTIDDGEIIVTCITNPHWDYCTEREW